MSKKGKVYYGDQLAGIIAETDEGYTFAYDPEYLSSKHAMPISLTMPLTTGVYLSKVLFAFFDGLIPEGWLLDIATKHWKVKPNDRFELLLQTCKDAIGAVSVIPDDNN
ncbi:HipA N-terminal domain-containing protein [Chitinophaga sp. HK235]|uniref:HipA N-terminal domain-containing protein n=1 Tax=Chitinophaga sp. HK235 TaxID=2952571 RepID=UPI001BA53478|nr:HipA N-terminal domain-containing protein [Chitinophaga sp. HK235]